MWNIPRVSLIALAAAFLLTGCVPTDPIVTPNPEPGSIPIFATEEEALAAATAAYAAYVKVSDQITSEGGKSPERIVPFVSDEQLSNEVAGFAVFSTKSLSTKGATAFRNVGLERYSDNGAGPAEVVVYLCSDVSAVRLFDVAGNDVTPSSRPDRQAFEVSFVHDPKKDRDLVVTGSEPWQDAGVCS